MTKKVHVHIRQRAGEIGPYKYGRSSPTRSLPLTRMAPAGSYWCLRTPWAALIGGACRGGEKRRGGAPVPSPREGAYVATMSRARSHLRAAVFLTAVSPRGATSWIAARRELSARPAPQEPGMEYQVSSRQAGGLAVTRGLGLEPHRIRLRQLRRVQSSLRLGQRRPGALGWRQGLRSWAWAAGSGYSEAEGVPR